MKALHKARQRDPQAVEQLIQEARVLVWLKHPAIVGVHGLGRYPGGGYFLVLDLIEGTFSAGSSEAAFHRGSSENLPSRSSRRWSNDFALRRRPAAVATLQSTRPQLIRRALDREAVQLQHVLRCVFYGRPDENDESAALELFQKYADQSISFTDCVSFVLMEKQNIKCAFSFDRHFTIAGFDVEP